MDTAKAIEFFEKTTRIALLLPLQPSFDCLAAAEALAAAMYERGKQLGSLSPLGGEQPIRQPELFAKLAASSSLPKEFIISLDTSASPVSQLRYEKTEEKIDIIFSPKENFISEKAVSFREGKTLCDGAIAIGVADIESLPFLTPQFLSETPVLNIDVSAENKNYGEVNLVNPQRSSLAEIVYDLVTSLGQNPLSKSSATLLLAAILQQTSHFTSRTGADTLLACSELMRLGADFVKAQELARASKSPNLVQLLGRASVRSRLEKGVLWSFLTSEDFEKTGRTPDDIPLVMNHLVKEFPPRAVAALLWQSQDDSMVRAILAGEEKMLEALAGRGAGKLQSPYLLISAPFGSFREAEEILVSLLAEVF